MICEDLSRYIIHTCIQIHTYIAYITLHTLHTYILTYIRTYVHTYLHTYIHTDIQTYTHMIIHVYIYIYDVECVKGIVWSMQFQLGNFEHIAFVYICGGFIHLVQLVTGHLAVQKNVFSWAARAFTTLVCSENVGGHWKLNLNHPTFITSALIWWWSLIPRWDDSHRTALEGVCGQSNRWRCQSAAGWSFPWGYASIWHIEDVLPIDWGRINWD